MLKITIQRKVGGMTLALEGKLAGPWVKELEQCWLSVGTQQNSPLRMDLSAVTFIDEEGKVLLKRIHREGAELMASGCLNKCIVEGIIQSESLKEEEKKL
jgi:ABC-type transporter Mla MlaB component